MTRCAFCPQLGVATTATTTSSEAFPFLCSQLGLSTAFGGGGNGGGGVAPAALCSSCHSLWEEVSVLYSNMQGLLNLMTRRVQQFKKNIDKGHTSEGHGPPGGCSTRARGRNRKRNPLPSPPPDEESMLSWWYPSASDGKRRKKDEGTEGNDYDESILGSETDNVVLLGDIKLEPMDVVVEVGGESGHGGDDKMGVEEEDYEIMPIPEERESDVGEESDPSYDPLQSPPPPPSHSRRPRSRKAQEVGSEVNLTNTPLDLVPGQRGNEHLLLHGFRYRKKEKYRNGKVVWECCMRRESKCPGKCVTSEGEVEEEYGNHNHPPASANEASSKSGQRRQSYTMKEKVDIINLIKSGQRQVDVAKEKNIPTKSIRCIWSCRDKILEQFSTRGGNFKKSRKPNFERIDVALFDWYKNARLDNIPINGPILKSKAEEYAMSFSIHNFKGSSGWLDNWKTRRGIVFRDVSAEADDAVDSVEGTLVIPL